MSNAEVQPASQAATPAASRPVGDIPSMLLQVADRSLLLPGVAVAEIVNYSYPERPDDAPEWLLGYISWRKLAVPLVSFDLLNGQPAARSAGVPRIAVLNNTGVSEVVPFIAIVIQTIPRLLRITPRDLADINDVDLSPAEKTAVNLGGELAFIPDVSVLERAFSAYLQAR